jgi:hypothetical protein
VRQTLYRMSVFRLLPLSLCLALSACAAEAVVTPRSPSAIGRRSPEIILGYVAAYSPSTGSLSIRMPNGDRLEGNYTFIAAPSAGPICFGVCSAGTASFGSEEILTDASSRPAIAVATNGRGKSMTCDLAIAPKLRGTGRCHLNTGEEYQVAF